LDSYAGADQKKYHFLFLISAKKGVVIGDNTLILSGIDEKVLFMTARPGRERAFVSSEHYLKTWAKHLSYFAEKPPQVAIIHSGMKEDSQGKAHAIPVVIENPREVLKCWQFDCKQLPSGEYHGITLFLDWPAAVECPKPIQLEVPSLFGGAHAA